MGLCGSSGAGGAENMLTQGVQQYVMNLVVQRATGSTGDGQMSFLTNLLQKNIPGAKIQEQIVPNASPNLFNISSAGNLIHSTEQSGPVQNNADSILGKLTNMAKTQATNLIQ